MGGCLWSVAVCETATDVLRRRPILATLSGRTLLRTVSDLSSGTCAKVGTRTAFQAAVG